MNKPEGWREGQTIFNFLEWLKNKKNYDGNQNFRMADPFSIPDGNWDKLYKEFLDEICFKNK